MTDLNLEVIINLDSTDMVDWFTNNSEVVIYTEDTEAVKQLLDIDTRRTFSTVYVYWQSAEPEYSWSFRSITIKKSGYNSYLITFSN